MRALLAEWSMLWHAIEIRTDCRKHLSTPQGGPKSLYPRWIRRIVV